MWTGLVGNTMVESLDKQKKVKQSTGGEPNGNYCEWTITSVEVRKINALTRSLDEDVTNCAQF